MVGYWVILDSPVSTERLARVGYDYLCIDQQHGLTGYEGLRNGLLAVDAGARLGAVDTVGLVRAAANDLTWIGHALDAGASGVIVPLIDTPEDAAHAVACVKYPPVGRRSYGPMRSQLRIGPAPAEVNAETLVIAMIETPEGLANVEAIAATPGLDSLYVGPSDLALAVGGARPDDPAVADAFEAALVRVREAAEAAGISVGIHAQHGEEAASRIAEGFRFVSVSCDLVHLEKAAAHHLATARG
ncbi:aldolase/citrate lyase family protein [Streptomyces sp. DSM 44915]|uniref:Aldolase/citrate lyase family protein n=2 Tax=Streptomyces chisholmiae TaxID=3075540 RepID=A0ABU2JRC1_9ACTN|nr:aldolase/citrate lyase family protein [Streptomyces sp. DSM 44915]